MADELKPCLLCNGTSVGFRDHGLPETQIGCNDCGLTTRYYPSRAAAIAAWNTHPAAKADSALVGELREKAEQADAAKRNLHGLPVLAMESDTHKGKLALWCDNGLAGVGQTCVAVNLGEFPDEQIKAIAALANIAATTDFAAILAALSDRDVVLEEAAKVAEDWMQGSMLSGDCATEDAQRTGKAVAQAIRALKGGVDE